jgi:hypothetical protein
MLTARDVHIGDDRLSIRSDEYPYVRILGIHARELTTRDRVVRILSIALAVSLIGWVFAPLGLVLFGIGAVGALLTSKRYELRAEFRAVDETGDHVTAIARGRLPEEYALFQWIEREVASRLDSNRSQSISRG